MNETLKKLGEVDTNKLARLILADIVRKEPKLAVHIMMAGNMAMKRVEPRKDYIYFRIDGIDEQGRTVKFERMVNYDDCKYLKLL